MEQKENQVPDRIWEWPCPNPKCQKTERLVQTVLDEDRASGRLDAEDLRWGVIESETVEVRATGEPLKLGDQVSIVKMFWDLCEKCGTKYCYRAVRRVLVAREEPKQQKGGPLDGITLPPGFELPGGYQVPNRAQRRRAGHN